MVTSQNITTSISDDVEEVSVTTTKSISISITSTTTTSSSPSPSTAPLSDYSLQWQRHGSLYILDCHPSSVAKIPGNRKVAAFDMVRFAHDHTPSVVCSSVSPLTLS
jgi:hypothetical protein